MQIKARLKGGAPPPEGGLYKNILPWRCDYKLIPLQPELEESGRRSWTGSGLLALKKGFGPSKIQTNHLQLANPVLFSCATWLFILNKSWRFCLQTKGELAGWEEKIFRKHLYPQELTESTDILRVRFLIQNFCGKLYCYPHLLFHGPTEDVQFEFN